MTSLLEFVLLRNFTAALGDSTTSEYKELTEEIKEEVCNSLITFHNLIYIK